MLQSIGPVVGNFPGVPNNLTMSACKLESVARRVRDKCLVESEPSVARRTTDDVENIDALNNREEDEADEEPRCAGEERAGKGRDKCD